MNQEQLEEVYRKHLEKFQRTATAIAGDREFGKEAVQEAFAKAVRARRQFRGDGNLGEHAAGHPGVKRPVAAVARTTAERTGEAFLNSVERHLATPKPRPRVGRRR
jgi:hypothetical protein